MKYNFSVNELCASVGGTGKYVLKVNSSGKADVWKKFSLVYKKVEDGAADEVMNFCACNKCYQVSQVKDTSGRQFVTKNLLVHIKRCVAKTNAIKCIK